VYTDTTLDLTAPAADLALAVARIVRLLPSRLTPSRPELTGVLLRAEGDGLALTATDGELSVRARVPVTVHGSGEVLVARRGLAETLTALDGHRLRLVVEGARLAIRTPEARFALPLIDPAALPRPADPPPVAGTVAAGVLHAVAVPVAGAASREHALPIFTGVRLRSGGDRLSLLATDRYRMAVADLPWRPEPGAPAVDTLVPAALLGQVARQARRAGTVALRIDGDRFGLAWEGGEVITAALGGAFPDRQIDSLLDTSPECTIEVEADALAVAVERASFYAGAHGRVTLQAGDGTLVIRGSDPLTGESEESVKATVRGDHVLRAYQAGLLLDALRAFSGGPAVIGVQAGLRATAFTAPPGGPGAPDGPGEARLRYLVVPMRGVNGQ
jgi:DNA polymerase-3 subunit beta